MQRTEFNIMANKVKTAQFKLKQHRSLGAKSSLSVYEVARLMDTIKRGAQNDQVEHSSIFFGLN